VNKCHILPAIPVPICNIEEYAAEDLI